MVEKGYSEIVNSGPGDPGRPNLRDLVSNFLTGDGLVAYDRNHSLIPRINRDTHIIKINGLVPKELNLTVEDLEALPQHEVVAALQCAGNRRHTMRTLQKEVVGINWLDGAAMNCRWRGPRVRDVLALAGTGVPKDGKQMHVAFNCRSVNCEDDTYFGSSITLDAALSDEKEVILALERNGKILSPRFGFPVRMIAPGIIGARATKWLDEITVQDEESQNVYQRRDYKILPETVQAKDDFLVNDGAVWDTVPAMQESLINSVIAYPAQDDTVTLDADGMVEVKGYAIPGGYDGPVVDVQVSGNGGKSWITAEFVSKPTKFSWVIWKARVTVERGPNRTIWSRATDAGGNTQPEMSVWNIRGVGYNGYGDARNLTVL
ncbi:Oxidoreductase, molybdopterin-binding domain-containing protein [Cadophora sp. MPI-SDFR-AT-0126]|nr:Oxidoreductase, molybdopterin-binding domain-containing protein [Leotiomycetes sp. MPI-SDFR-AT-0126]